MADDENAEVAVSQDTRWDFVENIACRSLNIKADKWGKMVNNEEFRPIIVDFFDKAEVTKLILTVPTTGQLTPYHDFTPITKGKSVYFIKRNEGVLPKEKLAQSLIFGDLSANPLEQLAAVVEDVISPILTNPKNYEDWPEVVSQDVLKHVHQLKSDVFVTTGSVRGETLLPMPVGIERIDINPRHALGIRDDGNNRKAPLDRSLIQSMQSCVIEWAKQIKEIAGNDSAQLCMDGFPTPHKEIAFWEDREKNLWSLYQQIKVPKVRQLATVLKMIDSTYYGTLYNVFEDCKEQLKRAQNIFCHLKPLQNILDELEQIDFSEIVEKKFMILQCFLDLTGLVWEKCDEYRDPIRVIVLYQMVSNLLIELARNYLDPENILKGEPDESLDKIKIAIQVMETYRNLWFEMKDKIKNGEYTTGDKKVIEWRFAPTLVFARFDNFVNRCKQLELLFKTANEYIKLEKIEFGGISGGSLSLQVVHLFDEFNSAFKVFQESSYDPLDWHEKAFKKDYNNFMDKVADFDRRLAKCACLGFEDCGNVEGMFKLLAIFGDLTKRPLITADFDKNYPVLLKTYDQELDAAKKIFDWQDEVTKRLGYAPVHDMQPQIAGQLEWARELRLRISKPREQLKLIDHPIMTSDQAEIVFKKFDQMDELITEFEKKIYAEWVATVDQACSFNMNQPILKRNDRGVLAVNFDRALTTVLREVRYLKYLKRSDIPDSAEKLFSEHVKLRDLNANLDRTAAWYNKIKSTLLPVEAPIVESQLQEIDAYLKEGETNLYWSASSVEDYTKNARNLVSDLEQRIQKAKDNIANLEDIMSTWTKSSLFERKQDQKDAKQRILDIENKDDKKLKRYKLISADGEKIHGLIKENCELLKANDQSDEWKAYLNFVDEKIIRGFNNCIKFSLDYLSENMENVQNQIPLFAAKLELQIPKMVFQPSLDANCPDSVASLQKIVSNLIDDIFQMASLIKRVALDHKTEDYVADMEDASDLTQLREDIEDRVQQGISDALEHASKYEQYQHLWEDDRQEFLRQFLTYGHILTPDEIEAHAGESIPESPPNISQYKEQIDSYEDLFVLINGFKDIEIFQGWFRVNIAPFKASLLNIVKKWSLMFKKHIVDKVENDLAELDSFIQETNGGLSREVAEGDYDGLIYVMQHLLHVRDREYETDNMFLPIKEYIDLLKSYNHDSEMKDEVHKQLADLPDAWSSLKKTATLVKQNVAPLQANEVAVIRRDSSGFDVKQHEFREKFRKEKFFRWEANEPYPLIFRSHLEITDKENEMEDLSKKADLFEVNIPEFKQLKTCRKEIILVKEVWDLATLVKSSIEDWKKTPWKDINVEQMDVDCKRFAKEIRTMDKEVRAWDVFSGLDSTVKNMITSLKVIGELQNPAVRDRHWRQLMQTTKVRFTMDASTTLSDLMQLNLHNFEDEVRGIVEKSVKELGMEKVLSEMDNTWSSFNFEHEVHSRTGTKLLKSDEELVETLEDNQVQLQALMTSKYIAHFLDAVSGWQKKLSVTDSVMTIWFEVQRTWSHLESIFIGSADIREQLKEDSERFDIIDEEFKQIMSDAEKETNVVKCTNKPGLYDHLEKLQGMLTKCEKALAEYLETKRLAFPRFYFVSSSDLLDILSNGTNPIAVCKHLEKLFDNLSDMVFDKDSKMANTMISQQGEKVPLVEKCDCDGQVETWLMRVLKNMQETVRYQMNESVSSYEDKPREQWLFDFPAQVALAATQIWWTTDVNMAFGRLEEGYENAIKDYNKKQIQQLNALINLLLSDLTKNDRQKIMTICTIDVHARDVVGKLIAQKTDNANAFLWQCQLRHRWSEKDSHCYANICDAVFKYSYEYLGNTPRLVITPLTDRCYITLTQSLHLIMGGAPAGPAGTGKTETTKDLGRALGVMVYVFNCSEQMDYKSCGNIYKGLAQTGAWGCFDEFNRISVEVLSVVAVQVKSIQVAIKTKKTRFDFEGEEISLIPTVGLFITMNPGYAGRTELPENLKALFRPCAMVVPDFAMIAEIMLVAEGFQEATLLSKKFITLYTLNKELLSKQDHYDWGLRAIKSVLVVAGQLKRADRERPEGQVLMRALRDFNIPKIVTDDMPVFMGLIGDLFPGLDVPRKQDVKFEGEWTKVLYIRPPMF